MNTTRRADPPQTQALAKELIPLADLATAHPGEFRELPERKTILTALAGTG
jgi:hypothetical protein